MGLGRWRVCALALLAAALGCEEEQLAVVQGDLEVPAELDFGDVQVGMSVESVLTLRNEGGATVRVLDVGGRNLEGADYQFTLPSEGVSVGPRQSQELVFGFRPFRAADEAWSVEVELEIDGQDPRIVILRGRGIENGLQIDPNPLDFGTVLAGSSRTLEVTLTNRLSGPVDLRSVSHRQGRAEAVASSGTGQFTIETGTDPGGRLVDAQPLQPGQSLTVAITYTPDPTNLEAADRARWSLRNCDFDLCEVDLDLRGRGTTAALECTPNAIDFGSVNPGARLVRTIECTNVAADTVRVDDWQRESGTSSELVLQTPPTPTDLDPGASLQIDVSFEPTNATWDMGAMPSGALLVNSTHAVGGALDPVRIPLQGRAGGPTISVLPASLAFGDIAVGTYHQKLLLVENRGLEALDVSAIDADVDGTGAFSVDATAFVLPAGTSTVVTVRFTPPSADAFTSTVRFYSNDSLAPEYDVPVAGVGIQLAPCVYRPSPTRLNFPVVRFTQSDVRAVTIENFGRDDCLMNDVEIVPATYGATTAFALVNGNQTGVVIPAGGTHDIPIEFTPTVAGAQRAELAFYISDPADPNPRIPIYGVGEPLVRVECPPPVTTPAGVPVTLSAMGITAGANITGYNWALTSFPLGGQGTPNQWSPNPPNVPTVTFLPFIVGVYDIQVTMTDDVGRMVSCTTQVTAEGQGLQVTMRWNGTGDVDLHVHDGVTTSPWFTNNDCYYSNRTPLWDSGFPAATGPNPELDFDNTSANGPENTRILVPAVGTTYTVAAHNFGRAANRNVTIEIFCGGVMPQAVFTSRPLQGTSSGNCSANDFWKVASVTFTGQNTCTVVPIDTYGPSSAACTAF